MITLILLVAAFICFALVVIGVSSPRLNLTALGLALWVLSILLTGRV